MAAPAGEWHEQHAFADLCASCHGGNAESNDIAVAHAGLVAPLDDADARCGSCHGDRTAALVAGYRAPPGGGNAAPPPSSPPQRPSPHGEPASNGALLIAICAVAVAGGAFVVGNERRRVRVLRASEATS
jgi:hypothetical protein